MVGLHHYSIKISAMIIIHVGEGKLSDVHGGTALILLWWPGIMALADGIVMSSFMSVRFSCALTMPFPPI